MDAFHLIRDGEVHWVQQKTMDKYFELFMADHLIGTLAFRSAFGTLAEAVTSIQSWTFKRVGFFNTRVTIRKPDEELDHATFYPRIFGDGVLQIMDGRSFSWAPLNFWRTRWVFYDNGDIPVLQFWEGSQEFKISEIFKTQAAVEILDASLSEEQLSLLVPFGFYLIIMHKNDTAAGAAAASSS